MKCKTCSQDLPKGSIFCMYCGAKVVKLIDEVQIPKPRLLTDGTYAQQVMINGQRTFVKGVTLAEYRDNVIALKRKLAEVKPKFYDRTLKDIMSSHIEANSNVLSPSTLRGYDAILRTRFLKYQNKKVGTINWQVMVNEETNCSAKSLANAWGLVTASLTSAGCEHLPKVNLRPVVPIDYTFLDYEQIDLFLSSIRGNRCEVAMILALHGLRMSELLAVQVSGITETTIEVSGSVVQGRDHKFVEKDSNKNKTSKRLVPIVIPRLREVLPADGRAVMQHPSSINKQIKKACISAGLPVCTAHDLRRSFASLCYHLHWADRSTMLAGGWSNMDTVRKVYQHLADKDYQKDIDNMRNYYGFTTDDSDTQ